MNSNIHFITYGDSKKYSISKRHIIGLAKKSKFFKTCKRFSEKDLDYEFVNKYKDILNEPRGGGYYLWKPKIILNVLKNLDQNDLLVYTDAGSSFNYYAKKRFFEYVEMLQDSEYGNLRIENPQQFIEKYWTTKEIFNYFNLPINSEIGNSPQLLGGHLIFKNNKHTEEFLNEFFKLVEYDKKLITDFYKDGQIENFKENRHDQSILSLLSKTLGGVIIKNETFFEPNSLNQKDYPFLSVRNYGHGKKDKLKYYFNYKNYKKSPIYF